MADPFGRPGLIKISPDDEWDDIPEITHPWSPQWPPVIAPKSFWQKRFEAHRDAQVQALHLELATPGMTHLEEPQSAPKVNKDSTKRVSKTLMLGEVLEAGRQHLLRNRAYGDGLP
jgi:hypothetical protein